jgi:hypothetical protein
MSIAYKNRGVDTTLGQTNSNSTPALVPYPTSPAGVSGDILFLLILSKYPTDSDPAVPAGWTSMTNGQGTGGTQPTTTVADTGKTTASIFYKIMDGTESGNLEVSLTGAQSGRMLGALFMLFSRTGPTLGIAACKGGLDTSTASISIVMGSDPGFQTGDIILFYFAANTDAYNYATVSVTVPGCVVGSATVFESLWTAGQDGEQVYGYAQITSGTSTGAPTLVMTASGSVSETGAGTGNPEGGAVIVRIRDSGAYGQLINIASLGNVASLNM